MDLLSELIERKSQLEAEIEKIIRAEKRAVVAEMQKNIKKYGITLKDLWGDTADGAPKPAKVPMKYRNPETGEEWSGRGRAPRWIRGELVWDKFLIARQESQFSKSGRDEQERRVALEDA